MNKRDNGFLLLDRARDPEIISRFSNIVLWGAGSYVEQVLSTVPQGTVSAVFDSNPKKWGRRIQNVLVYPPEEFSVDGDTAVIISASKNMDDIARSLNAVYCVRAEQMFPMITQQTLHRHYLSNVIRSHQEELLHVEALLEDTASKRYFAGYINTILTMNPLLLTRNAYTAEPYVYAGEIETIAPKLGDCIVDCGAFIGDTMERFVQLADGQCKFYGLEPVLGNYELLVRTAKKYPSVQSVMDQCAVGARRGTVEIISESDITVRADSCGTYAGGRGSVRTVVPVETLDRLFEKQGTDYIKMDIEGEEVNAILGGRNVIRRDRPAMLLSAYHMINHMWEIPLLVRDICPSYRIYCGHQPGAPFEPEFYCTAR